MNHHNKGSLLKRLSDLLLEAAGFGPPSFLLVGIKKQRIEKSKEDHMA